MIQYPDNDLLDQHAKGYSDGTKKPNVKNNIDILTGDLNPFDIYDHLKRNAKNQDNCQDSITEAFYCITCKASLCSECSYQDHVGHQLIKKSLYYSMDPELIDHSFAYVTNNLNTDSLFMNTSAVKSELTKIISDSIDALHTKLEVVKKEKLLEMNTMFKYSNSSVEILRNNIDNMKSNIKQFFDKSKTFFSLFQNNNDYENTIFLLIYDLMRGCCEKSNDINTVLNKIKNDYYAYQTEIKTKTEGLMKAMDDLVTWKPVDINSGDVAMFGYNPDYISLTEDYYKDLAFKVKKYNDHIANFRKNVFDIVKKSGKFDEISNMLDVFDSKIKQGVEFIFSYDTQGKGMKMSKSRNSSLKTISHCSDKKGDIDITQKSPPKLDLSSSRLMQKNLINSGSGTLLCSSHSMKSWTNQNLIYFKSKDDVVLDNRTLQRFFAYATVGIANKFFRIKPKLSVPENFMKPAVDAEESKEIAKPIIGTNEIQIYNRKSRTLIRKCVNLDRQLHGYVAFLDGTRHILIKDKLFITGGMDMMEKQYSSCLMFNIKDFTLTRMPDMNMPHAYHSIEYLDIFKSLLVIGGENNCHCEMLDLFTNQWKSLPRLHYPRANTNIFFDRISHCIYVLFGIKKEITASDNHSDDIEILDLRDIENGWLKIDYNNKAEVDFKMNLCSVFPLTSEKILIYGANKARLLEKCFAVFLMNKREIVKIDNNLMEELKVHAGKSVKLSKIIANYQK